MLISKTTHLSLGRWGAPRWTPLHKIGIVDALSFNIKKYEKLIYYKFI